jgi:hypothetical protein
MSFDHSTVEVKQLWWFQDGAIMSPYVRHRLWAAWGFCPRHTWSYLISECELRLMPRGVLVLYEDLASRAEAALVSRRWRARFRREDVCLTCDYLNIGDCGRVETGWRTETEKVNRMARTAQLVALDQQYWEPRTCPSCDGGAGPWCMTHLLAAHDDGQSVSAADRKAVAAALGDARGRMRATLEAICWPRTPVAPAGWAGLIEVLGWFGGWAGARQIAACEPDADAERVDLLYAGGGLVRT